MKQSVLLTSLFSLFCMLPMYTMQQPPKNPLMTMPQMTEEELLQFQKEIDAQIDQFVQSLPEEEQKQFYKDVEELSKVMETMSEEELMQFMDKVLADEQQMLQQQPAQPIASIEPKGPAAEAMPSIKVEEKPKPVEVKQPTTSQQLSLTALIDSITTSIERFMLKAQIIPELTGDIANWIQTGKLQRWPASLTWAQLKEKTDELMQRLKKLQDRDPVNTQSYRYLGHIQEPLKNNIQHLATLLSKHEPLVEAPAFGLGKVSKNSRTAIQDVLIALAEAVYELSMIEEFDKIFQEYGPRELELTKREEDAHKKAIEAGKTKIKPVPTIAIGAGSTGGVIIPESSSAYERSDYYGGPSAYYPEYDFDQEYDQEAATPTSSGSSISAAKPSKGSRSTQKEKEDKEAKEKAGADGEESSKGKGRAKSKAKAPKEAEDKKADMYLKTIERQLEKAVEILDATPKFTQLEEYIRSADPIDPALVTALRTLHAAFARAHDQAKALILHIGKAKKPTAEHYSEQLVNMVNYNKEIFESLLKQINAVSADSKKLSVDRRYAYLGDKDALEEAAKKSKDIGTLVPEPVSLTALADTMNQLYEIAQKEEKKKKPSPFSALPPARRSPKAQEPEE